LIGIVSTDEAANTRSNDNMTDSGSADSLVVTEDDADEEAGALNFDDVLAKAKNPPDNGAQASPTPEPAPSLQSSPLPTQSQDLPGLTGTTASPDIPGTTGNASTDSSPSLTVDDWKKKAIEQYPDLAVAGSPLNVAFVAKYKAYKGTNYFDSPDWPMRLAKECADSLQGP